MVGSKKALQTLPEPKNKGGNPTWQKGGPSPNPAGRPKGIPSIAGEVKEGLLRVFRAAGGEDRVIKLIKEKAGANKKEAYLRDQRFWGFLRDILLPLLPKKTEDDGEKRVVIFNFGDGKSFRAEGQADLENIFDVEIKDVPRESIERTGEGSPDPEKRQ